MYAVEPAGAASQQSTPSHVRLQKRPCAERTSDAASHCSSCRVLFPGSLSSSSVTSSAWCRRSRPKCLSGSSASSFPVRIFWLKCRITFPILSLFQCGMFYSATDIFLLHSDAVFLLDGDPDVFLLRRKSREVITRVKEGKGRGEKKLSQREVTWHYTICKRPFRHRVNITRSAAKTKVRTERRTPSQGTW